MTDNVPMLAPPRLPYHPACKERFGIEKAEWNALVEAVWPTAKTPEGIILALSYCKARNLDPFKRPVHIVPIWNSELRRTVESVWPGIGELRVTASRTGCYAGCDPAAFGEMVVCDFSGEVGGGQNKRQETKTVEFPEWCQLTVYRMMQGQRVAFPGPRVYWLETYATMGKSDVPNEMWETRPIGQLEKCAEAAALRRAFPEEMGEEFIGDEVQHTRRQVVNSAPPVSPGQRQAEKLLAAANGSGTVIDRPPTVEAVQEHASGPQEADGDPPPAWADNEPSEPEAPQEPSSPPETPSTPATTGNASGGREPTPAEQCRILFIDKHDTSMGVAVAELDAFCTERYGKALDACSAVELAAVRIAIKSGDVRPPEGRTAPGTGKK